MPSIRRVKLCGVSGECIWGVGIVGGTELKNSKVPLAVKNPRVNAGKERDVGLIPGSEDPLEEGVATRSSILAWRSHGQRSLVGHSPWGHTESDTTKVT